MTLIAIIEDDEAILDVLEDCLQGEGHRCRTATSAEAGGKLLDCELPDLVILDIMLNGVPTGWKLLDRLGRDPRTAIIPIVVCTADVRGLHAHETVLRERGIRFLAKPFDLDNLLHLVQSQLARRGVAEPAGTAKHYGAA